VLEAGRTYLFGLRPDDEAADPLEEGALRLYDATGASSAESPYGDPLVFTAGADGDFYVAALGRWGDLGGYFVTAETLADDVAGNVTTAATLTPDGEVAASIEFADDDDWFRIAVEAGTIYRFTAAPDAAADDPLDDPRLALYDTDGDLIDERWIGETLSHRAAASGDLFVSVRGYEDLGAYRVWAATVADEIADDASTDRTLAVGAIVSGRIDYPDDADWFAVALEGGRRYVFSSDRGYSWDSILTLVDETGAEFDANRVEGSLLYAPDADQSLFLAVRPGYELGEYRITLAFAEDSVAGGVDTTAAIAPGETQTGVIDFVTDEDWFAIALEAGRTYRFDLDAPPDAVGGIDYPRISVHDAAGNEITFNQSYYGDNIEPLYFSPSESASYFVNVRDYYIYCKYVCDEYWGVGDYELSMTIVEDALPADSSTPATLALGDAYAGSLDMPGDADWVRVELESGRTYAFSMALDEPSGHWDLGRLRLINAWGVEVASGAAALAYVCDADQTVFVEASSGYSVGRYVLEMDEVIDAVPADTSTDAAITSAAPAAGTIDFGGDTDWFRLAVEAGSTYRFDLAWAEDAADPYSGSLTLRAESGARLEGSGRHLLYSAPESGVIYLAADGALGAYALSMTDVSDAVAGSVATTGEIALGDAVADAVDFAGDQDWFRLAVEAGESYKVKLEAVDDDLYRPVARVFDTDGVVIAEDAESAWNAPSTALFTAKEDGFVFVSAGAEYDEYYDYGATGGYTLSAEQLPEGPQLLADAPAYQWYHGCCPTAGATLVGYWDQRGYGGLFDAVTAAEVRLTENVQDQISSPEHNAKYDPYPDDDTLPTPERTSIAGFMGTSTEWLDYGATYISNIAYGLEAYAEFRGYDFDARTEGFSAGTAARLVDEIEADRPVLLTVDSDGNGWLDHCIPAIGFEDRGEEGLWYAAYTTWSESETPIWEPFRPLEAGRTWTVATMTTFVPQEDAILLAGDEGAAPAAEVGDGVAAGGLKTLAEIREALGADGLFDAVDAAIFAEAEQSGRFVAEADMFVIV
jgi:hypothetical protein